MNWKHTILFLLCTAVSSLFAGTNILERFDAGVISGKLMGGATIDLKAGLEKGALTAAGNGKSLQYIYAVPVKGKAGDSFTVALNFKTTPKFPNNTLMFVIVYDAPKGVKVPSTYFRLPPSSLRWMHRQFTFTLPEKTTGAKVMLRIAGAKASDRVFVDFLRIVSVTDGTARGIDLETFDTTFDNWKFDAHLIFDHFMPGPGGKICNEWKEAKVGEAFFQANGNGAPMQYALYIDNIKVKPRGNYIFEAYYKTTPNFKFHANGILIFFYKDKNGKAIGQSRFWFKEAKEWTNLVHTFTVPDKCAFVDIGLNIRRQRKEEWIRLDHIRFRPASDKGELRTATDSRKKVMSVTVYLTGNAAAAKPVKSIFTVFDSNGKPAAERIVPGNNDLQFDLTRFKDGVYSISAKIQLDNGKTIETEKCPFSVFCKPDWFNEIGIQKPGMNAPVPWKNLAASGKDTVKFWNGDLKFNDDFTLRQITAGGKNLLKDKMLIQLNGKSLNLRGLKFKVQKSLAEAVGTVSTDNVKVDTRLTVDYLGFIHWKIQLKADAKQSVVRSLKVTLPVNSIEFVHRTDGGWTDVGAKELHVNQEWSTKHFYDNIMAGNVNRGVSLFIDKVYPAKRELSQAWTHVSREKGMSFEMITEPLLLKSGEKKQFDFAFCAYPYRPAEQNWKRLRFRAGKNSNFDLTWQTAAILKYAGSLPTPTDPAFLKKYLGKKSQLKYRLLYQIPAYILEKIPQWNFFRDRWKVLPSRAYNMGAGYGPLTKADFRDRAWADLYVKTLADNLKEYPWNGIYYDCFGTDVFTEHGETFNPIFDLKDFHERIYIAQRIHDKNSLTVVHAGADQGSTMLAYANVVLMGEQYRGAFSKASYYNEFMTIERFRFENAVNMGPDRMLLPQYRQQEKISSPRVACHVMGMALLHNLMIYPNFIRKDIELSIRDRLYAFGLTNAEFQGYWLPGKNIVTGAKDVYASYYTNPKGYFVTFLNYGKTDKTFKPVLPFAGKNGTVFDPVTGKSSPWNGEMTLEPAMAKVVEFRK